MAPSPAWTGFLKRSAIVIKKASPGPIFKQHLCHLGPDLSGLRLTAALHFFGNGLSLMTGLVASRHPALDNQ